MSVRQREQRHPNVQLHPQVQMLGCGSSATLESSCLAPQRAERSRRAKTSLTGCVGADVDDVALGPVHLVLVRRRQLGLHHDGVLRPRLERQDEVTRFHLLLLAIAGSPRSVHICNHPAVGAAGVLPVKLSHISEGSF